MIVGRPNVGKSCIFNRLIGARKALVYDQPGVTRDCLKGTFALTPDIEIECLDTGGIDFELAEDFWPVMREHILSQVSRVDWIWLVVDGRTGQLPIDAEIAQALRSRITAKGRLLLLVNKVDNPKNSACVHDFHRLGISPVFPLSAEHGSGFSDLLDHMKSFYSTAPSPEVILPEAAPQDPPSANTHSHAVTIIGRPNVGKSSLINQILGQPWLSVSPCAGTTRDPIDIPINWQQQRLLFIDTAGVRRHRDICHRLEKLTVAKTFSSIDRAAVAVLLLDGTRSPSMQDARLARMIHDKGRGLILAVNKADLITNPDWKPAMLKAIAKAFPFAHYAPVIWLSAKTGLHIDKLFAALVQVLEARKQRVTTGELNRFFASVVAHKQPPVSGGKVPRLYYVSQPHINPPTFVFSTSANAEIPDSYSRYIENALRKAYGFVGTPIWLKYRSGKETPGHYGMSA
jgi:GTP-binding protein